MLSHYGINHAINYAINHEKTTETRVIQHVSFP
jgi:hypothetical protein